MVDLILVGFMGSGKTTIGHLLADFIHRPHLDLDQMIVAHSGQSINQIFTEHGERYFRELESKTLASALSEEGVLSTGGGTPVSKTNRQLLHEANIPVIYLKTSPEIILERLQDDHTRPLFRTLDKNRLIELFQERESYYEQSADIQVITDQKTPSEIVHEIKVNIGL